MARIRASLTVVAGANPGQVQLKLPTVIGRSDGVKIKVRHPLVSRRHCELREESGLLCVQDLGSTNGTYVNNQRFEGLYPLRDGDLLRVGSVTFRIQVQSEQPERPEAQGSSPSVRPPADRDGGCLRTNDDGMGMEPSVPRREAVRAPRLSVEPPEVHPPRDTAFGLDALDDPPLSILHYQELEQGSFIHVATGEPSPEPVSHFSGIGDQGTPDVVDPALFCTDDSSPDPVDPAQDSSLQRFLQDLP